MEGTPRRIGAGVEKVRVCSYTFLRTKILSYKSLHQETLIPMQEAEKEWETGVWPSIPFNINSLLD